MDTWRERFTEVVHEINGLKSPATIRMEEIHKLFVHHFRDMLEDTYKSVDSHTFHKETMLLSQQAYDLIFGDQDESE